MSSTTTGRPSAGSRTASRRDTVAPTPDLVERLRTALPPGPLVARDLGRGTGSMLRRLAGLLEQPQHWVLHGRDPAELARATAGLPARVTAQTGEGDLGDLDSAELTGTSVVTASALLDVLTAGEVASLARACAAAGCAALLTRSVVGSVLISPPDRRLDGTFAAAFNDNQRRRRVDGRRLLGPDAVAVAAAAFRLHGARVFVTPSPWRLGPDRAGLREEWLRGWLAAACEQRPELRAAAGPYLRRRLQNRDLRIVVGHADLLALPGLPS